jgi:carbon-monoxide dehydrogenase small subunit
MAAEDGTLHPIQEAFSAKHGLQCGFCTPGFLLTVSELLAEDPHPDEEAIRAHLSGNLCRCTGYQQIFEAVEAAIGRP